MFRHRKLTTIAETHKDQQQQQQQQQQGTTSLSQPPASSNSNENHNIINIEYEDNDEEERKKLFKIQKHKLFTTAKIISFLLIFPIILLWKHTTPNIQQRRHDDVIVLQQQPPKQSSKEASMLLPSPHSSTSTSISSIIIKNQEQQHQQHQHQKQQQQKQPGSITESSIPEEGSRASSTLVDRRSPNSTTTTAANSLKISNNNNQHQHHHPHPHNYHVVFSTGCSSSQDWQSYVFFYHAYKCGQRGTITRIVSGCSLQQKQQLETTFLYAIQSLSTNFKLHFTPDYSQGKKYTIYFNKPFGMLHWMKHELGYEDDFNNSTTSTKTNNLHKNPNDDSIIMLLDPDQIILKPLTHDYSNDTTMKWVERSQSSTPKVVQHKSVIAQQYGYGGQWISPKFIKLDELLSNDVKTKSSPLWKLTRSTAKKFAAGPPYLATSRDMYSIVKSWCDFVPRVHKNFPGLLAEMFAFNLAAHHVHRRPTTTSGLMVSRVEDGTTEGWYWLHNTNNNNNNTTHDDENNNNNNNIHNYCSNQYPISKQPHSHPYVLHYCQTYKYYEFDHDDDSSFKIIFLKYVIPKNFFSCESDLLQEPTTNISINGRTNTNIGNNDNSISTLSSSMTTTNMSTSIQQQQQQQKFFLRHRYMVCTLIPAVNEALTHFKRQTCGDNNAANFEKRLVLSETKSYKDYVKKTRKEQLQKEQKIKRQNAE